MQAARTHTFSHVASLILRDTDTFSCVGGGGEGLVGPDSYKIVLSPFLNKSEFNISYFGKS